MLQIRDQHLSALSEQQKAGFVARMATHLRATFPAEVVTLDDERLHKFVDKVCSRAEQWGIKQEAHVERLLELYVSFDHLRRNPLPDWISEIVADPRPCGEHILLMLEDRLLFEERTSKGAFYQKVDHELYSEGELPADAPYREKWRRIAARLRDSKAVPEKEIKQSCLP